MGSLEQNLIALLSGILFALGLSISGMTQPHIVLGFLDFQNWNPTLLFVMIAALVVHAPAYALLRKRKKSLFGSNWHIPSSRKIDWRLIFGAVFFGIGWGITGYCPGPAVTSLASRPADLGGLLLMVIAGLKVASVTGMRGKK